MEIMCIVTFCDDDNNKLASGMLDGDEDSIKFMKMSVDPEDLKEMIRLNCPEATQIVMSFKFSDFGKQTEDDLVDAILDDFDDAEATVSKE